MKKIFALMYLLAISFVSMAQNQVYYEWKNGTVKPRSFSEIDSIAFSLPYDIISFSEDSLPKVGLSYMSTSFAISSTFTFPHISQNANTEMGVCYSSTNPNPTIMDDSKVVYGKMSTNNWHITLLNLSKATTYYYRPYVQIYGKVYYGEANSFSTYAENPNPGTDLWIPLGTGKIKDAFIYDDQTYFDVQIEQNDAEPNTFRLINPYAEILYGVETDKYLEFSVLPKGYDFDGTVLEAEYVVFKDYSTGEWNSNYPEPVYAIHPYRFGRTQDRWNYNVVLEYQDNGLPGEISLAPIYYLFNAGGGWDKSSANTISVLFPGYTKRDYSASVEFLEVATDEAGTSYARGFLTLGADAKNVKAIVMPASADAQAVADSIASGEIQAINATAEENNIPFDAKALGGNKFQIIAVVLNNNSVKNVATASFEYYGENGNPWKSLGVGYYTDDIVASLFGAEPATYAVEIMENTESPGLYRVMNPYSNSVYPYADNDCAEEGSYLEINATDAEGVYIEHQSLGFDWGYGEISFVSEGARYLSNNPVETVKNAGYLGTVVDGIINFPSFERNGGTYQGVTYMGESGYYAGQNGKIQIILPSAFDAVRNAAKVKVNNTSKKKLTKSFSGEQVDIKQLKVINVSIR